MSIKASQQNILTAVDALAAKVKRGEILTLEDFATVPVTKSYSDSVKKSGESLLVISSKDPSTPKAEKSKYPVTDELGNKLINVFSSKREYEPITLGEFEEEIHTKKGTTRGQAFKAANPTLNKHQMHKEFTAQHKNDLVNELAERKTLYKQHSLRLYADKCKAEGKIFDDETGNWKADPAIKEAEKAAKKAAKATKTTTKTTTPVTPTDGNQSDSN